MGSGFVTKIGDNSEIGMLKLMSCGDTAAALALVYHCLAVADSGEGEPLIATIEAMTFARVVASTGDLKGLGAVISICGRLADIFDAADCEGLANNYRAEALAIADLATDILPPDESDTMMAGLTVAACAANPETLAIAAIQRANWAPAFE